MYCNFFEDFDISIDFEDVWMVFWTYFGISFLLLIARMVVDMFISFSDTTTSISFLELVSFGFGCGFIGFLIFIIIAYCMDYFKYKKDTYSLFKFKDFKKWYSLTPEKFVFDEDCIRLYYLYTAKRNKNERQHRVWFDRYDTTTMYPETLLDAVLLHIFIWKLYKRLLRNEKAVVKQKNKVQQQKDKIFANTETIRVMNSLQEDINRILKESQTIINIEQSKLQNK